MSAWFLEFRLADDVDGGKSQHSIVTRVCAGDGARAFVRYDVGRMGIDHIVISMHTVSHGSLVVADYRLGMQLAKYLFETSLLMKLLFIDVFRAEGRSDIFRRCKLFRKERLMSIGVVDGEYKVVVPPPKVAQHEKNSKSGLSVLFGLDKLEKERTPRLPKHVAKLVADISVGDPEPEPEEHRLNLIPLATASWPRLGTTRVPLRRTVSIRVLVFKYFVMSL